MLNLVISGYYGFKNFGDEAILSVLTEHLKSLGANVTVITSNPAYTSQKDNVETVKTFDIKNIIRVLKNSDALISGGGSLLQDVTSLKSLMYYAFIIFLALIFKKKVLIFAQGIGPLNSKLSQFIVKNLLKQAAFISVRDEKSLELLADAGISAKLVCDPIFSVEIPETPKEKKLVVQLRSFPTLNDEFLNELAQNINKNFSDKKIEILSLQDSLDKDVCEKFNNILKNLNPNIITSVKTGLLPQEIINTIANAEYLIGMRFHALLIGLRAGTKTLAINYDIKVENLAKSFDLPMLNLSQNNEFENEFEILKNLDVSKLIETSKSKVFDWSEFDKNLCD